MILTGSVVGTTTVYAQPAPPPSDARELMQLGVKLLKSQDYLGALAIFKDAYNKFASAKILLNIGTTLHLLNRNAEAVNIYQRYLDSADADPARRAEVEAEIAKLEVDLGRLEITAPPEAELQVGSDDWVPASAAKLYRVVPHSYTVHARRKGFKPFETTGQVEAGKTVAVVVVLVEEPKLVASPVYITVPGERVAEEPRTRLGALVRGHFDVSGGAAAFVGGTFDVTNRIQAQVAGILGSNFGGFVGGNFAIFTGTLRPIVSVGFPIFYNDGARIAVRGAAGLEIVANRHFGLIVELGVEHNFNPQDSVQFGGMLRSVSSTSFIPALGVTARL